MPQQAPLAGIRILDLTIAMAGPMSTQRLGEMGAEVIKIEAPGGGDFARHWLMADITRFRDATCFVTLNRNKRSLVLDLKSEEGRKVLYRLVRDADVFVQNFRPRVAARLGIDYPTLSAINDRLVYASISGYGEDGPMTDRPGQDLLVQCFTGLTSNGGTADGLPHASPLYMVDTVASHMASEGILAGLVARGRTGRGQQVKVSLAQAIMEMQTQEITSYLAAGTAPPLGEMPQVSRWMEPPYGIYRCAKGFLAIAQADLAVLAREFDLPRLAELKAERPDQSDGRALVAWRDEICRLVAGKLIARTDAEWFAVLTAADIWCGVVESYESFLEQDQAQRYLVEMTHPLAGRYRTVKPGIAFSDMPEPELFAAPLYGADSRDILAEAGLSAEEIDALVAGGQVIAAEGTP